MAKKIVAIASGVAATIGFLANATQVLDFFGVGSNDNTSDNHSSVIQTAETAEKDIQSETELITETETEIQITETAKKRYSIRN